MTTPTSSFEMKRFVPLYKNILRQNRGYFGLLTAIVLLFYPLQYILEVFTTNRVNQFSPEAPPQYHIFGMGNNYTAVACGMVCVALLVGAFTLALKLNSYLFSKKAVDVYHALPISRTTQVLANTAAAMTILWVPLVLSNVVIAVSAVVKFGAANAHLGGLLLDTVFWFVITLAIYLVVTVVCTQVGTSFDAFFHSGVLLFAMPAVAAIYLWLCDIYLYGFQFADDMIRLLSYLSPVLLVINHFVIGVQMLEGMDVLGYTHYYNTHWMVVGIYAVLCVAMAWLACRLYARRQSERAEVASSAGFVPLIVQLVGTYVGGIMLGMLFRSIEDLNGKDGFAAMITWSIVGAAVTFVLLEVIFNRGFKSLKKHAPLGAGMVGAMLLSLVFVMTGLFGYETRVPVAASVASVTLDGRLLNSDYSIGTTTQRTNGDMGANYSRQLLLTDQNAIDYVTKFHTIAANRMPMEWNSDGEGDVPRTSRNLGIVYHLKNGRKMTRYYSDYPTAAGMELLPLLSSGEYVTKQDAIFFVHPALITLTEIFDGLGGKANAAALTQEEKVLLVEAMRQDRLAMTAEMLSEPGVTPKAYIRLVGNRPEEAGTAFADGVFFPVSALTPHTLRFLEETGNLPAQTELSRIEAVSGEIINREFNQSLRPYSMQEGILTLPSNDARGLAEVEAATEAFAREQAYNADSMDTQEVYNSIVMAEEKYGVFLLTKDPAVIARLAELVRPSWRGDAPALKVVFHRDDKAESVTGVIPLSLISPEDMEAMQPKRK